MAPAKSVPMNAFMLYMSGSGVQIFSMMVVGMLLTNPLKSILQIKSAFAPYLTPGQPMALLPQQLVFIACQLMCMGLGIYKCWSMGLLPTESSDWLAWREPRVVSTVCLTFSSSIFPKPSLADLRLSLDSLSNFLLYTHEIYNFILDSDHNSVT